MVLDSVWQLLRPLLGVLIALGLIFMGVRTLMHGGHGGWGHGEGRGREFWNQRWNWENHWDEKLKHDWMSGEKPKRDDSGDEPRYARTANGDQVFRPVDGPTQFTHNATP